MSYEEDDFYDPENDPIDPDSVNRLSRSPVNQQKSRGGRLIGVVDDAEMRRLARVSPGNRARAALRMREAMRSWEDIVWVCGYDNGKQAQADVTRLLASTVDESDIATARQIFMKSLESQAARSIAMASVTHVEDEEGNVRRNAEQSAWHREAREDLKLLGQAGGLMKAQQVEILNPAAAEINELAQRYLEMIGAGAEEAEVLALEVIPDEGKF